FGCRIAGCSIMLGGHELFGAEPGLLRQVRGLRVGYVAQSAAAAFNPAHTIDSQVCEAAVQHGMMRPVEALQAASRLYARLRLPDPAHFGARYPHQVSGGQLQRAMTAMAMICRPDLIVFDEPTTALDVTTQVEVLIAIRNAIRGEGTAALYISHDLAVVAHIADPIMVLRKGALVEEGPVWQILEAPRQAYTRELVGVRRVTARQKARAPEAALFEAANLTARYRVGPPVLSGVSISIRRGTTVAVVGESGSGKSTLARVVTGLLPPA